MRLNITLLSALTIAAIAPLSAQAPITSITANWSNDIPDGDVNVDNTLANDIRVCWPGGGNDTRPAGSCENLLSGSGSWGGGDSGYRFLRSATPFNAFPDSPFSLGEFIHLNRPIQGTSLSQVDLNLGFIIGGQGYNASWRFTHDETPNDGPGNCCNDLISFSSLNDPSSSNFTYLGDLYVIDILGFGSSSDNIVTQFSTVEGASNSTNVYGVISLVNTAQVPEPMSAALLFVGMLGVGAAARRRARA